MTATTIRVQMAQRKDTAANWTAANPILLSGEIGYETDTKKFKIGNGSTNWNSLAYLPIPDGSGNLTITGNLEIGSTGSLTFEGSTADGFETTLAVTNPTADRTITLPDRSGTVITSGDTGTVTSTMILDGTIVNDDVNASAAIAGTKITPDFGSQNVTTTGTATAASLIPSSSTVPTNGVYLPAANSVAISTGGSGRLFVKSDGSIAVGAPTGDAALEIGFGATGNRAAYIDLTGDATYVDYGLRVIRDSTGANAASQLFHRGTGDFAVNTVEAAPFIVRTNNTERLRITSAGLVGVGTSGPSQLLSITTESNDDGIILTNSSTNGGRLRLNSTGAGGRAYHIVSTANGSGAGGGKFAIFDNTASDAARLVIDSSGNVGVGTTSPGQRFTVGDGTATGVNYLRVHSANSDLLIGQSGGAAFGLGTSQGSIVGSDSASFPLAVGTFQNQALLFGTNNAERARIDSSGRLLVGTSTAAQYNNYSSVMPVHIAGTGDVDIQVTAFRNDQYSGGINFSKSRGATVGANASVADGDIVGNLRFFGADGTNWISAGTIQCRIDGTPGANDMPGRLVFSTTADGASSPTERARINNAGYLKFTSSAAYRDANGAYHEAVSNNATSQVIVVSATSSTYTGIAQIIDVNKAANSDYSLLRARSADGGDVEFNLRGDGNGYCDGAWTGGGADYAEYFEWSDSNPNAEDRRGISVVLDNDKIREAVAGEDPIGVISGNPSVVGDAAWNKWSGKYLRDEFGTYIQEDYEVADDDGNTVIQQRRKLNLAYDPDVEYISREQRPEWDCVGLMGKLRIRKGQITGSRWIKMRDINDSVEEWLVR